MNLMKTEHKIRSVFAEIFFYTLLISMLGITLMLSRASDSGPKMFGDYSAFVVLTGSMEEVIPKGSLVVTKRIDPTELKIGDDITYMISESATVTHRIIEIEENYLDTGQRAFRTQGVMNQEPDINPVAAVNVVGKVIWHNKMLGRLVELLRQNWPLLIFLIAIVLIFVKAAEIILKKEEPEKTPKIQKQIANEKAMKEQAVEDKDGFALEIIEL